MGNTQDGCYVREVFSYDGEIGLMLEKVGLGKEWKTYYKIKAKDISTRKDINFHRLFEMEKAIVIRYNFTYYEELYRISGAWVYTRGNTDSQFSALVCLEDCLICWTD